MDQSNNPKFTQPVITNPVKDRKTHEVVNVKVSILKPRRNFGTFSKKAGMGFVKAGSMRAWKKLRQQAKEVRKDKSD